ncbi:peroxisomal targeting signal 2 receptor-like [Mya arenaria]|uniref:peroxisomal targeting signal 2 receptor-like n=1 Tax=Mya arenaria TaxID=6604 RepID=UPI0022E60E3D|nr:peroxisomal targeting signal 2 receptor-like [Mya arenaria]
MTLSFKTKDRHGYSVKFSPYLPDRFVCATSQYYGIAGRGTLFVFDILSSGIEPVKIYEWNDGLFDAAWSENNENVVVVGAGDGSLLVYDVTNPKGPLKAFKEHSKEVSSVDWSPTRAENFILTASWDSTIKLWSLDSPHSVATFTGHSGIVYSAIWSPRLPGCFATASGDKTLRVWDRRTPQPQCTIQAHEGEVLTCDWNKYDQNILYSGSVDCSIRGWDIRNYNKPLCEMTGHRFAVRRVKTSPFNGNTLASCSYDFTVRTWDVRQPHAMEITEHHTEFVYGLDFNLHRPGQIVDCGWDSLVHVYKPRSL